ncbi:hypothetical protein [Gloeobacter kilaueensis]|uniref:Uncharacterized protein n=1 Tax=Gloeobacter kilaueensis (strain ATCC BAA-2537 / CCAP 1431/1 / ULC 316 / JS1) TaxID=1183438 RepID=U5QH75_GLOK1|nr:hypothetical protein [Gloeobacter kilaueensis]AGY56969.1 hypothetical protein GKIL_0723 [Gloeobacter kilaueensis JS1]
MNLTVGELLRRRFAEHGFDRPDNAIPLTGVAPVDWAIRFHIERHDVTHILMEAPNTPLGEAYVGGAEAASLGIPRLAAIVGFAVICRLDADFDRMPRREMLLSMLRGYDRHLHCPTKIVTGQPGVYSIEAVLPLTLGEAQRRTGIVPMAARTRRRAGRTVRQMGPDGLLEHHPATGPALPPPRSGGYPGG